MKIRTLDIDELNSRMLELRALQDAVQDALATLKDAETDEAKAEAQDALDAAETELSAEDMLELEQLESLRDEIGESRGKINDEGGPFVHENDFRDYAMELAEETGAISRDAAWPYTCIDWDRATDELKMDYSVVTWDGVDYLYRS